MKILCLSDLHLRSNAVSDFLNTQKTTPFLREITATVAEVSPDVVVVTGDTVWARQVRKLSFVLRKLIPGDIPIVATLENHEFWERTFEETLTELKEQTFNDKNIFYLDLIGAVELGGLNFVGGTLFFDGSIRIRERIWAVRSNQDTGLISLLCGCIFKPQSLPAKRRLASGLLPTAEKRHPARQEIRTLFRGKRI